MENTTRRSERAEPFIIAQTARGRPKADDFELVRPIPRRIMERVAAGRHRETVVKNEFCPERKSLP
jgi:hypothetical protein